MNIVVGIESGFLSHAQIATDEELEDVVQDFLEICDNPDYDDVYTLIVGEDVKIVHNTPLEDS